MDTCNNPSTRKPLFSFLARYGLALASTALAALVRLMLPWVLTPAPYLGFYPAVVVSAALGGVGPGLVATFTSLFLVNFVFGSFNVHDHGSMARQVVWVAASFGVSLLAGMQRKARISERRQSEALRRLNDELEARVAQRTAELRERDQVMLLQSRQAAMGEMIGNIAHQWRQPLNTLGLTIQQLELFYEMGKLDKEYLERSARKSMDLIHHMSQTIDDFRNYFSPDKEKVDFTVREAIASTLSLLEDSFKNQHIAIDVATSGDAVIYGHRNEFAQALLNIMINAKDALTQRGVADPRVILTSGQEGGRAVVTITDNAGGIPAEILGKIFDPYFTTKGPQQGTGIGLFMSKTIIEKNMGGRLSVQNVEGGAQFRIEV